MAKKITERIGEYMGAFPQEEGIILYHAEYVKEGPDHYLRVYIDTPEEGRYVSTEDCEKVSRFLEEKLDQDDPIAEGYILEVSSPGMDRPLITDEHFQRYMGELVDVKLYKARDGEKTLTGTLVGKTAETISLKTDNNEVVDLPLSEVAKVQLAVVI